LTGLVATMTVHLIDADAGAGAGRVVVIMP
jgi:hypothetical protein